jgi:hypothetical protein
VKNPSPFFSEAERGYYRTTSQYHIYASSLVENPSPIFFGTRQRLLQYYQPVPHLRKFTRGKSFANFFRNQTEVTTVLPASTTSTQVHSWKILRQFFFENRERLLQYYPPVQHLRQFTSGKSFANFFSETARGYYLRHCLRRPVTPKPVVSYARSQFFRK